MMTNSEIQSKRIPNQLPNNKQPETSFYKQFKWKRKSISMDKKKDYWNDESIDNDFQ
jgi:hypothetical protein